MPVDSMLIANRGEIAVRIVRAAKELGVHTIQVYSEADANSLAVQMADEAIEIGPAPAKKSYLNIDAIIAAAQKTKADAIHPGYGFLAENEEFANAVNSSGMKFIGPAGDTIRRMGDKATARQTAAKAGVPIVPGSDRISDGANFGLDSATEIGFPIMIKASAGGGGRGIRIAYDEQEYLKLAPQAYSEANAAFGDGTLYLEKVIEKAHHIEVQILGDGKNFVHCYERECSLQRRRQKVWEESPSPTITSEVREAMCNSAVELASAVDYSGAGTIEFLYDRSNEDYFFIEMNTRIQVEHPVTEAVTGIDLIKEMIMIGSGEQLSLRQSDIKLNGHAIEVRINAEDPENNFMPFPGCVTELNIPNDEGIRFDHMIYEGYQIPPYYDSLLGKLIVHAQSRPEAIGKLKEAIEKLTINGVKTTIPLFKKLVDETDVQSADINTNWLEHWLESNFNNLS